MQGTSPSDHAPRPTPAGTGVIGRLLRSSFVREMRRRRVPQVVASYGMISWGLIQLATTVFPLLNLPNWSPRAVLIALIVGFPLTVFLAWNYDLTPDGLRHASDNPAVVAEPMSTAWRLGWVMVSLAMVGGGTWLVLTRSDTGAEAVASKGAEPANGFIAAPEAGSVAVLPFLDMTADSSTEYFADGMTEDIINALSKVGTLRVTSRTSVMQYKGGQKNVRDIANELGVRSVIEGSVRRFGNQLRITVNLVDAQQDRQVWAETFDRELSDVFAVQSEIARRVASALNAEIAPTEVQQLARKPTESVTAYEHYLQARDLYFKNDPAERDHLASLLRKALAIDPQYAEAYTGLATYYHTKANDTGDNRWLDSALVYAKRALQIDSTLQSAYFVMARVYNTQYDFARSNEVFRKGIALNPNTRDALWAAAGVARTEGRYDENLRVLKQLIAVEPTRSQNYFAVGDVYLMLGLHAEAQRWLERSLEMQPDLWPARSRLVWLNLSAGRIAFAEQEARTLLGLGLGGDRATEWMVRVLLTKGDYKAALPYVDHPVYRDRFEKAYVYTKLGREQEAARILSRYEAAERALVRRGAITRSIGLAQAAFVRGNKSDGYRLLEQALRGGWQPASLDGFDFTELYFPELKQEPQFRQLLAPMQTQLAAMRQRVIADKL